MAYPRGISNAFRGVYNQGSQDGEWLPPEGPGGTVIGIRNEQMGQELAKLHEDQVQEMRKYFDYNIENLLGEIVRHQENAENESAFNAYGALFTLAHRIYEVFASNYQRGLEPLMLNLLRVMNGVYIRSDVTGREFFVEYQSHFEPEEINHALYNLVEMTIGELPELTPDSFEFIRSIVNPIMETADSLIHKFGDWVTPAVTHINAKLKESIAPILEQAEEVLKRIPETFQGYFIGLPTIQKIYLGDSLLQLLQFGYDNAQFIYNAMISSSDITQLLLNLGTGTIANIGDIIRMARDGLAYVEGITFNTLVFVFVSVINIYGHQNPDDDTMTQLQELCITYAGIALKNLKKKHRDAKPGFEAAQTYGLIIYKSLMASTEVIKQLHLAGYAANPWLVSGFVAYTMHIYINSFHTGEHPSLVEAFRHTFINVFGPGGPQAVADAIKAIGDIRDQIMVEIKEADQTEQGHDLQKLIGGLGDSDAAQRIIPIDRIAVVAQKEEEAARNILHHIDFLSESGVPAAAGPANTEMANASPADIYFGGGKARRRKTIKKKHAKKAHKGKSKKGGKVRKVKKARKSKAKKAHKGKKHTKRRS